MEERYSNELCIFFHLKGYRVSLGQVESAWMETRRSFGSAHFFPIGQTGFPPPHLGSVALGLACPHLNFSKSYPPFRIRLKHHVYHQIFLDSRTSRAKGTLRHPILDGHLCVPPYPSLFPPVPTLEGTVLCGFFPP